MANNRETMGKAPAVHLVSAGGTCANAGALPTTTPARIGLIEELPPQVRRLAWRCDKAIQRGASSDRVFALIEDLALAMEAAGYQGAGGWLREIAEEKEGEAYRKPPYGLLLAG